ncbi:MAG: ThiF family adenylyltransferase [Candidatus Lokiarchaeia archaeon]
MANRLFEEIESLVQKAIAPDGKEYQRLSIEAVRKIANKKKVLGKEVEIAALEKAVVPERYQRNMGTVGIEGQIKLLRSKVVIAGAGGLGGTVTELLARVGVGHLIVADGDSFEDSNINRHLLCQEKNLRQNKSQAAVERVRQINSGVEVTSFFRNVTEENATQLIKGANVIVDALGEIGARFILEAAAKKEGIPLVHGAIAGFYGQVTTILPEDEGLIRIYGSREKAPQVGSETELGTPTTTASIVASLQAQEVIKVLLGAGNLLHNRLLTIDAESGNIEIVSLSP